MKKILLILIFLFSVCLLAACVLLYTRYEHMIEMNQTLEEENTALNKDVTELNDKLQQKEFFIAGQKEHLSELNQQLADLESSLDTEEDEEHYNSDDYGDEYPDLYAGSIKNSSNSEAEKTVYLTFDDGPSDHTPKVLDLLDAYGAKATFFVVYTDNPKHTAYLKEIVNRGHTLAVHSYSHDYNKIYQSVDAFLTDFQKVYQWIYEETGQSASLFRFPGGSTKGNASVVADIIAEMERRGFIYYDWNVSSGDGSNLTTAENMLDNIYPNVNSFQMPVVLMHDGIGKQTTLNALPAILDTLANGGYDFDALNETLVPIQYQRKSR